MVADTPDQPIELKTFCCRLVNDPAALLQKSSTWEDLPVIRKVTSKMLLKNFNQIRSDIDTLVEKELTRIRDTPTLRHLEL